jgi:HAD superfamily hydrolase (TIGR01509 family)
MKTSPFDAIIFDHDGTLIDTESCDFRGCQLLFAEYGLALTVDTWAKQVVGHTGGYDDLLASILTTRQNGLTAADLWQRLKELWQTTFTQVELMPGVDRLIPQLHHAGFPLAIATASDQAWVNRWLGPHHLLPYFQVVATRNNVTRNKPAPDVYLFAAAQLGVRPERCLVFEDSVAGMQSAKAAGMAVIAVPSHVTKTLDFSQADGIIEGLTQVTVNWIEQLNENIR